MSKKRRSSARPASRPAQASTQPPVNTPEAKQSKAVHHPQKRRVAFMIALGYVIVHGLIWAAIMIATRRQAVDQTPVLYGLLVLSALLDVVAGVAMWLWKKWGAYLYLAGGMATGLFVTLLSGDLWLALGSFMPVIVVTYIVFPDLVE